jgi:hypothetical protein
MVPPAEFDRYQKLGELRLVDWGLIYEMAGFIGFDVSDRIEALNAQLARNEVPNPNVAKDGEYPWAKVSISSIDTKMFCFKLLEKDEPEKGYWVSFKLEMSRCIEAFVKSPQEGGRHIPERPWTNPGWNQ